MQSRLELRVAASFSGVRDAAAALADFSAGQGLEKGSSWPFQVALDEVLSNIVRYGLRGGDERREIQIELRFEEGVLDVTVLDDAPAFDPLSVQAPDLALPAEQRSIGGLGIAIVRRLMDAVEYERRDGFNRLRFGKRVADPAP